MKKINRIMAILLIIATVAEGMRYPKAYAFAWNGENIRTIATVTSCVVAVLSYLKGYWDGEKAVNCNCNCNCGSYNDKCDL
jgi:uncharacterized membrane protein